ncbi:MAG: hypothetical protein RL557_790 [archaeon]
MRYKLHSLKIFKAEVYSIEKMVKKNISRSKRSLNTLNVILFILSILAIVWIFSYPSYRSDSLLKGELGTLGPNEVNPNSKVIECKTDADCPYNQHCKTFVGGFGICVDCISEDHCTDASRPICDQNKCVECFIDTDCYPAAPRCKNGWCEVCINDNDCNNPQFPFCKVGSNGQNNCFGNEELV